MPFHFSSLRGHRWLASFLVVAFALRALIPAGYMPGGEGHLGLQICPDGFPATLLPAAEDRSAHAGHHHHHLDQDAAADTGAADQAAADEGLVVHGSVAHNSAAHGSADGLAHSGSSGAGHTHDHKSWMSAHCVFSAVASAAPPASGSPILTAVPETEALPVRAETTPHALEFRFRIAQPRGPPHLA